MTSNYQYIRGALLVGFLAVGAALLLLMLPGWILNLGHRLEVVYRIYHRQPPVFRGFRPWLFIAMPCFCWIFYCGIWIGGLLQS